MNVRPTAIPDVLVVEPEVFRDDRGFFLESWHAGRYAARGVPAAFVQDNHSRSGRGVLRGLHYQLGEPQGKLVRVASGQVFDVAVDLRRSSPTFGRWVGEYLSADDHRQLWIPPGFAHGFYVVSDTADLLYKCTGFYAPAEEHTLRWDDPALAIAWPLGGAAPVLSRKDAVGHSLSAAPTFP
jgi:dTDP-4-dehydrorhamnose 3,5-epimerase